MALGAAQLVALAVACAQTPPRQSRRRAPLPRPRGFHPHHRLAPAEGPRRDAAAPPPPGGPPDAPGYKRGRKGNFAFGDTTCDLPGRAGCKPPHICHSRILRYFKRKASVDERAAMYQNASRNVRHAMQHMLPYHRPSLRHLNETARGNRRSAWCPVLVGSKRRDMATLGGKPWFPRTVHFREFNASGAETGPWMLKHERCAGSSGVRPLKPGERPPGQSLVQRRIEPLLTEGVVWSFRLYALLDVHAPPAFRVAVIRRPLLRFAGAKFAADGPAHLYASGSFAAERVGAGENFGYGAWPWRATSLAEVLDRTPAKGLRTADAILSEAAAIAADAVAAGHRATYTSKGGPTRTPCGHAFGVDFMLDPEARLWVAEVQARPEVNFSPPDYGGQEAAFDAIARGFLSYEAGRASADVVVVSRDE